MRLCLLTPDSRDRAVLRALADESSRIVVLGIMEAERACPPEAEARLAAIASSPDGEFAEFRTQSIRALARLGSPGALETLVEIAAARRRGLRVRLPEESPELLAAIHGLATNWPEDPRVMEILALARTKGSAALRQAAS